MEKRLDLVKKWNERANRDLSIRKNKSQKGITLIALVITIIVLLILAGVTINILFGERGILKISEEAALSTRGANVKEQVELWKAEKQTDKKTGHSGNTKTEKELLDDLEINQKILKNEERNQLEEQRTVTIGNQVITLGEYEENIPTGVYPKLYSYKDGREGKVLELSHDVNYIDSELQLEDDYDNVDVGDMKPIDDFYPGYSFMNYPWIESEYQGAGVWVQYNYEIVEVKIVDRILPNILQDYFIGCERLKNIEGLNNIDTSNVSNMQGMFLRCSSLTNLDISNFKTDNVTNMGSIFSGCSSLTNLDISNFKTDNVTNMWSMFSGCSSLTNLDVSSFKTDNVTSMGNMFSGCSNLTNLDVSSFKTDNVTYMGNMFSGCSSLTNLDVSNFKTDNVTNMEYMFSGCSSLTNLDISNFKTDNVTNMSYMFSGCKNLIKIYVNPLTWVTGQANTDNMFNECGTSEVTYKE